MEVRRSQESDLEGLKCLRRGWYLGGEGFKRELLGRMQGAYSGAIRTRFRF